jgi:ribosome-binding protein aMBF1 (putative translation factor)
MAIPYIKLLQEKPLTPYRCDMCGEMTRKNKFSWESHFTGRTITICRECAYKERYGTNNMKKAKKERILEQKETNK